VPEIAALDAGGLGLLNAPVTPVHFYHLEQTGLEAVLPRLVQASLGRAWRVVIQAGSEERAEALAAHLWSFDEESFIPHGTRVDGMPDLTPVWLTATDENPNGAKVRFCVDGAPVGAMDGLERVVIIFEGRDEAAVEAARSAWKRYRAEGHAVSYWQQDEQGRWQNRAG
jgi:DNA polymerase-3 subunit chi